MGEEVALYGTIAKMKLKPGSEEEMMRAMEGPDANREGHVATYVFKSDADPNVHFVTTVFESKSAYKKFADSPDQSKRFNKMRELLAAEEIVGLLEGHLPTPPPVSPESLSIS